MFSIAEACSLFPGFRFCPTDEELILYYLKKKLLDPNDSVELISEVDICKHEPWDLPAQSVIKSEIEWFFFCSRGRKYPNGSQSKRGTESGYWKATGKERDVKSGSNVIGTKRTLVFHIGRAPKGQRTEWIMHEYSTGEKSEDVVMVVCRLRKNSEFHLSENARRDPNLLAIENGTPPLSGVEQSGPLEGEKTTHSRSKDVSSNNNSHSVEQMDPGSESDDKATNVCSQYSHSDLKKGHAEEEEEDCYADIMKDDIIKLDESSLIENPRPLRVAAIRPKSETVQYPFQGTANRRLRLRRQRMGTAHHKEQFKMFKFGLKDIPIEHYLHTQQRIVIPFIFLFVVIITLSILFVLIRDYIF